MSQRLVTIKNRRDFVAANAHAKKYVTDSFILQMNKREDAHPIGPAPRIGYTVTKKMGNAVIRNRIKRRLREAARQAAGSHMQPQHDYILISRASALTCDFSQLLSHMEIAFSRIHAKKGA